MNRYVVVLLLVAAVVCASHGSPQGGPISRECGPNEVFDECDSDCPPTCGVPAPKFCTLACNIRCRCKEGYLKNANGACVLPSEC